MFNRVLMVCTANICRSPMAEGLLRQALIAAGRSAVGVSSAGLNALVDQPADDRACRLMHDQGVDISSHRARQLTTDLTHRANLIVVMEDRQKKLVEAIDSTARGKVYRLGQWQDREVPDPYGKSDKLYEEVSILIREGVNHWVRKLTA